MAMPPGDDAEASRRAALFRENRFEMGALDLRGERGHRMM
jgi:hypothetical protein